MKSGWHCGAVSDEALAGGATSADAETNSTTRTSPLIKLPSNPRSPENSRVFILVTIAVVGSL